jgi:uncharacterized repeat protein (TIGR01451 family)
MNRRVLVPLAALATFLATASPAATAAPPNSADPGSTDAGKSAIVDDLEPADVTAVDPAESPSRAQALAALGKGDTPQTYLVRLKEPAVPTYEGGVAGLPTTAPDEGDKLDPGDSNVRDYAAHLEQAQGELIGELPDIVGRNVEVTFTYQYAANGFAAVLTPDEAKELFSHPDVASIAPDKEHELHTDRGPQWMGADALWDAMSELGLPEDYKGEGIVIGTIDTGISPGNRSFAETGEDGYTPTNPLGEGNFLGACDPSNAEQYDPDFVCNSKLIGAYEFGGANPNGSAVDYDGHGSHTASTSGGNVVHDVTIDSPTFDGDTTSISGVAPHANVISYLGCCTGAGLTASIDQAIADGVDVINYSIGSSDPGNPWADLTSIGFLNARAAGIFVATSNGNDGPADATTGSPSSSPWLTTVGASTHDRLLENAAINLTSSEGNLADLFGKSVTTSLPSAPIVYAGDFGSPECGSGTLDDPVNDWEPGTFDGEIVVCDRGTIPRLSKGDHVMEAGGGGVVHVNDEPAGTSLNADAFAIPGVHLSYEDGQTLKAWLNNGATDHTAAIRGTQLDINDSHGDQMAAFSSRGPNRAIDIIVPHVTAPGVDILAAIGADSYTSDIHGIISGTSMSSPHVAGAGALLTQARPGWTPAQMQSALMTTARDVVNHDGEPATPYAQGNGHVNLDRAVRAGLLFDETIANYFASDPQEGGDPKTLNLPSFSNTRCLGECSWERTASVPDSVPSDVTWTSSVEPQDGLSLSVALSQSTVSPGDTMEISVTADVSGAAADDTLFGEVHLIPDNPDVPAVVMPVAVVPVSGVLPGSVDIDTRRNAGSHLVEGIESIEVSEFTGTIQGFSPATLHESTLVQDPTNGSPYDDLTQVDVFSLDVPEGATRLIAEMLEAEMPDADMFVGTGDAPSEDTEVCSSTTPTAAEACEISNPDAGTWWVLIQNWGGSEPDVADAYTLATAVVPGVDLGNGDVAGPEGTVPTGEPYDVSVVWDIDEMAAGERWYGTAVLGSSPDSPDDIGSFPVTITRVDDDVTKEASVSEAEIGDTFSYDLTVAPNLTAQDLTYTITDTVPEGLTIDPDSVTGGGYVDGQTITWEITMPTAVGQPASYTASTPATSQQCADWAGFLDLGELGIGFASLDGDTAAANAFSAIGPFSFYGEEYPNLVVAEDGLVTVAGGYGGSPWNPQAIPNAGLPNGVIAPLWSDLELSLADERGMRLAQSTDLGAAVVQWDDAFEFTDDDTVGESVGKFQTWIYNEVSPDRPEITFEYGEVGALPALATIGVEDFVGSDALAILGAGDPSTIAEEGGSLCIDFEGPELDPVTVSYDVTVADRAASGTYTNSAEHVTSDPYSKIATASTDVEISGIAACTETIDGRHFGPLVVDEGVTCLEGAKVVGPVQVRADASLRSSDGTSVVGPVYSSGAEELWICDSRFVGGLSLNSSSAVTFGDPTNGCDGNSVIGPVKVTDTAGPSVIGGNTIVGILACRGNEPAPVNNGEENRVLGIKTGQCRTL